MADKPKRIQRKRVKGWRMPENAVYVGRPTKWGNPYYIEKTGLWKWGVFEVGKPETPIVNGYTTKDGALVACLDMYKSRLGFKDMNRPYELKELRGKDLACWCRLDQDCHADVLLELANKESR